MKSKRKSVWISGISGRMGTEISQLLYEHESLHLIGGSGRRGTTKKNIDSVDVILDFSTVSGNEQLLKQMSKATKKSLLIGTTGLSARAIQQWTKVAHNNQHRILFAPNTSFGIYTMAQSVGKMAALLAKESFDIEIVETHHNKKKDAPSGTAKLLVAAIQRELPTFKVSLQHTGLREPKTIGVHAIRGGGVFGEHEVRFIGPHEEITLSHRAFSRQVFAQGAIELALKLAAKKDNGFWTLADF